MRIDWLPATRATAGVTCVVLGVQGLICSA